MGDGWMDGWMGDGFTCSAVQLHLFCMLYVNLRFTWKRKTNSVSFGIDRTMYVNRLHYVYESIKVCM